MSIYKWTALLVIVGSLLFVGIILFISRKKRITRIWGFEVSKYLTVLTVIVPAIYILVGIPPSKPIIACTNKFVPVDISILSQDQGSIYYYVGNSTEEIKYAGPFTIDKETTLTAYVKDFWGAKSEPNQTEISKTTSEFEIIDKSVTWEEAKSLCRARGGDLAVINSASKQKAVVQKIREHEQQQINQYGEQRTKYYWIGGSRNMFDEDYYWITQELVSGDIYANWMKDEPSYYDRNNGLLETCMMIFGTLNRPNIDYYWNDENNSSPQIKEGSFAFICEYKEI